MKCKANTHSSGTMHNTRSHESTSKCITYKSTFALTNPQQCKACFASLVLEMGHWRAFKEASQEAERRPHGSCPPTVSSH